MGEIGMEWKGGGLGVENFCYRDGFLGYLNLQKFCRNILNEGVIGDEMGSCSILLLQILILIFLSYHNQNQVR